MTNYIFKGDQPLHMIPNKDGLYDILDCEIYIEENGKGIHVFNAAASEEHLIKAIKFKADVYLDKKYKKDGQILYIKILERIKQKES
jgi:hypothetical protein